MGHTLVCFLYVQFEHTNVESIKKFTTYRINTSVNILRKRLQYGLDTQVLLALALQCARCRPLSPRGQDNQKTPEQKSRPAKLYHKQTKEMQESFQSMQEKIGHK